jgi:hypothetical protein
MLPLVNNWDIKATSTRVDGGVMERGSYARTVVARGFNSSVTQYELAEEISAAFRGLDQQAKASMGACLKRGGEEGERVPLFDGTLESPKTEDGFIRSFRSTLEARVQRNRQCLGMGKTFLESFINVPARVVDECSRRIQVNALLTRGAEFLASEGMEDWFWRVDVTPSRRWDISPDEEVKKRMLDLKATFFVAKMARPTTPDFVYLGIRSLVRMATYDGCASMDRQGGFCIGVATFAVENDATNESLRSIGWGFTPSEEDDLRRAKKLATTALRLLMKSVAAARNKECANEIFENLGISSGVSQMILRARGDDQTDCRPVFVIG